MCSSSLPLGCWPTSSASPPWPRVSPSPFLSRWNSDFIKKDLEEAIILLKFPRCWEQSTIKQKAPQGSYPIELENCWSVFNLFVDSQRGQASAWLENFEPLYGHQSHRSSIHAKVCKEKLFLYWIHESFPYCILEFWDEFFSNDI